MTSGWRGVWSRKQVVDGVYQVDEGAWLDDCFHFLQAIGVMALLEQACGTAIQRAMLPACRTVLLYGLKTLCGMKRMNALPSLLCSDEALRPWVGFHAQQVRDGVCQCGATTRQAAREPGPMCPDTLANTIVQWHVRDPEGVCNGAIRALAKAGALGPKVTGIIEGPDLETTERYRGGGPVPRTVRSEETRGTVHAIEVTVYGWNVLRLIDARTKMPLAVKVGKIQEPDTHWTRALVIQARAHLAGHARLHKVVFERGVWDSTDLWWLDQQGLCCVVPANATMAVTADARAQAAAGAGITHGRRVHMARHGQGRAARTERLATEVVGMTGLTTDDQDGTPEHGRQHHRRDFQGTPLNAVVVRQWAGKDDGPGGQTVFLTNGSVDKPLHPFDDDDDRSLIETCCLKDTKQPWDLGPPPQPTERAVRGHVLCTRRMCALATAYRLPCEREDRGRDPVGWQRWRRQLLEQTRDQVIVLAQGYDGIFHLAEYSLL